MDKIDNKLFLNYKNPIGSKHKLSGNNGKVSVGAVHLYDELVIPAGPNGDASLSTISESFAIEARKANMPLSQFAPLDPIKIIIAVQGIVDCMGEIKRDLTVMPIREFGNQTLGECMADACGYSTTDESNYANLCVRYNKLVGKVNALYLPQSEFSIASLEHRCNIYKDDDGDRYQFYLYRKCGMHVLDVDPASPTVGQLVFSTAFRNLMTTAQKLTYVEGLLQTYAADEDFTNFISQAVNAGLPTIQIESIKTKKITDASGEEQEVFVAPEFKPVFDINDIESHTNEKFIPVLVSASPASGSTIVLNLNIWEDTSNNSLRIGKLQIGSSIYSGIFCPNPIAALLHAVGDGTNAIWGAAFTVAPDEVPLVSHFKAKSEEGCMSILKYHAFITDFTANLVGANSMAMLSCRGLTTVAASSGTSLPTVKLHEVTFHSPFMLVSHRIINLDSNNVPQEITWDMEFNCLNEDFYRLFKACLAYKPMPLTTVVTSGDSVWADSVIGPMIDFDYLFYSDYTSLSNFMDVYVWNRLGLLTSKVLIGSTKRDSKSFVDTESKKSSDSVKG